VLQASNRSEHVNENQCCEVLEGFRNTLSDDTTRDMLGWGTLEEVETRRDVSLARLSAKLAIRPDLSAPPQGLGSFVIRTGESTGESELFFDIARGRVQRVTTALTQTMTMSSSAPNGGDVSMQMLIKSTVTLELVGAAGQ
jgi:hypothetical protein